MMLEKLLDALVQDGLGIRIRMDKFYAYVTLNYAPFICGEGKTLMEAAQDAARQILALPKPKNSWDSKPERVIAALENL